MKKDKYKAVEDFFTAPLTFRQKLKLKKHQIIHEILTAWGFWKSKLIYVLIGVMLGWIIGLPMGAWLGHKNEKFWQSAILEPDREAQVEMLMKQNEAMVNRLIQLKQALEEYIPPKDMDIMRPSREE